MTPAISGTAAPPSLIPGLPDEVAELCLLHLPFPYHSLARSVSSTWNSILSNPSFFKSKPNLSPYIFVFTYNNSTLRLQWQAFNPNTRRWFILPPMPLYSEDSKFSAAAFGCVAVQERGELYVVGGLRSDVNEAVNTTVCYRAATNSWSVVAPMKRKRSFVLAGAVGGKIVAAGSGDGGKEVECYEPETDRWVSVSEMRTVMSRYDAAVIGKKLFMTEGWTWPFTFSPRSAVYDLTRDTWEEMSVGMREGWTGASTVVDGRLFIVSEYGDARVKTYNPETDKWALVSGSGAPTELRKPYAVNGAEGKIYMVGRGMNVGVGTVTELKGGEWKVEWELVKGPPAFEDLMPCNSLVLYA